MCWILGTSSWNWGKVALNHEVYEVHHEIMVNTQKVIANDQNHVRESTVIANAAGA